MENIKVAVKYSFDGIIETTFADVDEKEKELCSRFNLCAAGSVIYGVHKCVLLGVNNNVVTAEFSQDDNTNDTISILNPRKVAQFEIADNYQGKLNVYFEDTSGVRTDQLVYVQKFAEDVLTNNMAYTKAILYINDNNMPIVQFMRETELEANTRGLQRAVEALRQAVSAWEEIDENISAEEEGYCDDIDESITQDMIDTRMSRKQIDELYKAAYELLEGLK